MHGDAFPAAVVDPHGKRDRVDDLRHAADGDVDAQAAMHQRGVAVDRRRRVARLDALIVPELFTNAARVTLLAVDRAARMRR